MKKILIILFTIVVCSCSRNSITLKEVNKTDDWEYQSFETATPESQGVNSVELQKFVDKVEALEVDGIVILRHGKKIYEEFRGPYTTEMTHNLFSVTKSVNATLIGIAIDQGYIDSVEVRILDIFPEYSERKENEIWNEMTIRDLLTMSSGLPQDDEEIGVWVMMLRDNWLDYIFSLDPIIPSYGRRFVYSNISSYLLSAILAKTTGDNPLDYARINLFKPLGITKYSWDFKSPSGVHLGATSLNLRTEDLAKLGQLYLNKGLWNGKRVVSEKWITDSIAKDDNIIPWSRSFGYGFQWWLEKDGSYSGRGSFGQFVIVYPKYDMVVTINSTIPDEKYTQHNQLLNLLPKYFIKTLKDEPLSLPENKILDNNEPIVDGTEGLYPLLNIKEKFKFESNITGTKRTAIESGNGKFKITVYNEDYGKLSITIDESEIGKFVDVSSQDDILSYIDEIIKSIYPNENISKQHIFCKLIVKNSNEMKLTLRAYPLIMGYDITIKKSNEKVEIRITNTRMQSISGSN